MKKRTIGAERLEWGYLSQLKESLQSADPQEANEVIQSVRRLTEDRLASLMGEEVSEGQMEEILKGIGSPEKQRELFLSCQREGNSRGTEGTSPKEKSRRGLKRILSVRGFLAIFTLFLLGWLVFSPPSEKSPLPISISVSLKKNLEVTSILPLKDPSRGIITAIEVAFNNPLSPSSIEKALRIHPPVKGQIKLRGQRVLVLQFKERLRRATPYRIEVTPSLKGSGGETFSGASREFNTPALALEKIAQSGVQRNSVTLSLRFNGPINPQELARHLKITTPEGNRIYYSLLTSRASSVVRLQVWNNSCEQLLLKIKKELVGTEGPLGLKKNIRKQLKISLQVKFLGIAADYEGSRPCLSLRTNTPLDALQAKGYIKTDPPVNLTFDSNYEGLRVWGDFESGKRYLITVKKGLSAGAAGNLERDYERVVWFGDRPEKIELAFRGKYISPKGLMTLPLRSVNVKKINLKIERLYQSNLVEYALRKNNESPKELGKTLLQKELLLGESRNREVETLLDLKGLTGEKKLGVFGIQVSRSESYWDTSYAVVVVTDLGLSARISKERATLWVTSLSTSRPVEGTKVFLYSQKRQLLGWATTGKDGLASVDLSFQSPEEEVALVVASKADDLTYLTLPGNGRPRGESSAKGRPFLSRDYEVYGFSERGVYRPGDKVFLSSFVRGTQGTLPPSMPLEVTVNRPDSRELLKKTAITDDEGRMILSLTIPQGAPTGQYRVRYSLPGKNQPLGQTDFVVAEYMPRTLRMRLQAPRGALNIRDTLKVKARVEYLFGDPARNLKIKGRAYYRSENFKTRGWKKYTFGKGGPRSSRSISLSEKVTDRDGRALFSLKTPGGLTGPVVKVNVNVQVLETGGRALIEGLYRRLYSYGSYLGLKMPTEELAAGKREELHLALVRPGGQLNPKARKYRTTLFRVLYSNVLKRVGGNRFQYDWTRREEKVSSSQGFLKGGRGKIHLTPSHPGSYRILVESPGSCPVATDFYVQGPGAEWAMENPEELQMNLDKREYRVGEKGWLYVRSPFKGTALISVETDRVLEGRVIELKKGLGKYPFTIKSEWRPNVYLTATVVRAVEPEEEWRPHRASGVIRVPVNCGDRKLDLSIESPTEARPDRKLNLAVRVREGAKALTKGAVILMAVDEGVLALTGYKTPSPWKFFYGLRRLDVREYDMFAHLVPELAAWKLVNKSSPGGSNSSLSASIQRMVNQVKVKRVKTAVLFKGTLKIDSSGMARASFTVPEYVGELRIMAFAARGKSFGSAEKALPVKSPLMARPSWPRFLAPGDEFILPIKVFNRTGKAGEVTVKISLKGPLQGAEKLERKVFVKAGEEETIRFWLKATGVGKATGRIEALLQKENYTESVELAIRPGIAYTTRGGTLTMEGNTERTIAPGGEFLKSTGKTSVVIGGSPVVELSGALKYLLKYPYGCLEQTTSRLVPLVYLNDLARLANPGSVGRDEISTIMQAGFQRLKLMQTSDDGLSMWPGGSEVYPFGSLYAADLLGEARKGGYEVPEDLRESLLRYINRQLESWTSARDSKGRPSMFGHAAYGCYILARQGRPPHSWMATLEETLRKCDREGLYLPTSARFHLAGAYSAAGVSKVAKEFLLGALLGTSSRQTGGYLDSPVREKSLGLMVLLDLAPESPRVVQLANQLKKSLKEGYWATTQENAFALMALGKYASTLGEISQAQVVVTLPEGERRFKAREGLNIKDLNPGTPLKIKVEGKGKVFVFWSTRGVPLSGKAGEKDSGLSLRREIFEADGKKAADPKALVQGRLYRIVVELKGQPHTDNLLLVDLLPAGFEVDEKEILRRTPRQARSQGISVVHEEKRDDRILVFCRLQGRGKYTYLVRAVTCGKFVWPSLSASCMYDPSLFSNQGRGMVEIR